MYNLNYFLRVVALVIFLGLFSGNWSLVHSQESDTLIPKLDIVVIVDESASMWEETDLDRARLDAFNLLIDSLGGFERSNDNENVRVSVIAFGSADLTRVIVPFTAVNAESVGTIKQAYQQFNDGLANPPDGLVVGLRWTDALHALQLAEQQFTDPAKGHRADHKPAIIIMSDGQPETQLINDSVDDFDNKLQQYINQIREQAARFQSEPGGFYYYEGACQPLKKGWVPIYTIGVRKGATLPENYQQIWRRLAEQNGGAYYANPEGLSAGNLGGNYYQIYTDLICQPNQLDPLAVPFVGEYEVNNLYSNILFTVLKENDGISVNIYRPDGSPLSDQDPNVIANKSRLDEVWSIKRSEPWAGTWRIELTGSGSVYFSYQTFTDQLQINTLSPMSNFTRACAPLEISLRVENSDGSAITDNVEGFSVQVTKPFGEPTPLGNLERAGDLFTYRFQDTCTGGEYNFEGVATINFPEANLTIEQPWNKRIVATLDPYLEVVSPPDMGQFFTNEPLPLQVDIKVGDRFAEAMAAQMPPVTASIFKEDGTAVGGPVSLHYDGSLSLSRMTGEIAAGMLPEGQYTVEFRLDVPNNSTVESQRATFSMLASSSATIPTPSIPPTTVPPTPAATPEPPAPPEEPEGASLELIAGVVGVGLPLALLVAAVLFLYMISPMRTFSLRDAHGTPRIIGQKWLNGKFPETHTFPARDGTPIKLKFSPAQDADGHHATRVTLVHDLPEHSFVEIDRTPLWAKEDNALITQHSQLLTIDGQRYEIRTT